MPHEEQYCLLYAFDFKKNENIPFSFDVACIFDRIGFYIITVAFYYMVDLADKILNKTFLKFLSYLLVKVNDCRICGDPHSVLRFAFVEFADERKLIVWAC